MPGNVGIELSVLACASVAFTAGVPSFAWQSGDFEPTIADTGTGNIGLTLKQGIAADACAIVCTPRTTLAASGAVSIGVAHTSAALKQVTILQEQAAGAASALADVPFDIVILGKP